MDTDGEIGGADMTDDWEPEVADWGYYDDHDDYDEDMEPDDCGYGSFGAPQLGTEDCDFRCPLRDSCYAIFEERKNCVFPLFPPEWEPNCHWFHMGSCYIDWSNYTPSRIKQLWTRLKCRLRILPENPISHRIQLDVVENIEEGHERTDVSCEHGSRWIWWDGIDGKGAWQNVVLGASCDCGEPPRPFKEEEKEP